jgi:multiple antibiotic resistance protein
MPGSILEDLITLFVVLDPIGSIPIFLNATEELGSRDRPRVALVAVFVALLVLMLFLYCGQYALEAMHISIPAFRNAAVLFVFALQMIFGGHHSSGSAQARRTPTEVAIFPVAMPGIASPGALLAVVLLTDNDRFSLREETLTAGLTVAVLVLVLIILLLAARIQRYLGAAGIMVITQIMGLVLAAFSVQQIVDGALEVFARGAH